MNSLKQFRKSTSTWSPRVAYVVVEITDYHYWLAKDCDPQFSFKIYYNHVIEGNDFAFPAYLTSEVVGDTNDPGEGFLGLVTPEGNIIMGARGEVDAIYVHPDALPWLGVYPETFIDDDDNLYYLDLDEDKIICGSPEFDDDEECGCDECCGCDGYNLDEIEDIKINSVVNKTNLLN